MSIPEDLWPMIFVNAEDYQRYMLVSKKVRNIAFSFVKLDRKRLKKRFERHISNDSVMEKLIKCNDVSSVWFGEKAAEIGNIEVMRMLIKKGTNCKRSICVAAEYGQFGDVSPNMT